MARRTLVAALVAVLALGGYGVADAADVVPGPLTTGPAPAAPAPYPGIALPAGALTEAVPGPDVDAPVPTAAALEALAADLRATPGLGGLGLVVADAVTGTVLLDDDGAVARTPASSLKILTAAAALDALGTTRTLETRAVLDGDTVVLVGGGDVLLAAGAGDPDAVVGHAGLADLARQAAAALAAQGVRRVAVGLDDTLFSGPLHAPGVSGIDLDYVMPIQPLAVDTGRTGAGYSADPAMDAAGAFAAALTDAGVTVTGEVRRTRAPGGAAPLAAVASAPSGQVVRQMLKTSDNTLAEVLGRLVAVERGATADFEGATAAVLAQLGELGVDTTGVRLTDVSGLGAANRVTATALVDTLLTALEPARTALHALVPSLPVAHLDGTLDDRLPGEAAGRVRAKTGTLLAASSLSGTVVTADGRLLVFSVLTDGLSEGGTLQGRQAIDAWAERLAACGCG
ncbi:D-alanyl-D-alanine carboxypeptidase/D-alanyl-D-alanine endopeptidase [Georgenia ruanii]|uniref:D-alanyl-D-alanine carboxypeptidase/D-alanyl-D-alanine-endopeptidase n=1 Tax=Georgenia ruanii TaxID=348442 RepID=A0A7J9V1C9_9MICO|nr:D-alanyl-D-alanine carboxypeptidase/D-alanyl-D-alanine-endopeptidase [Georgenia ruanii]MPV90423.1 D-alanyl-D-alanine carboxypeptidase/D-alanyl-D-alanine-endopeptidase [Georgenia ruanii]